MLQRLLIDPSGRVVRETQFGARWSQICVRRRGSERLTSPGARLPKCAVLGAEMPIAWVESLKSREGSRLGVEIKKIHRLLQQRVKVDFGSS